MEMKDFKRIRKEELHLTQRGIALLMKVSVVTIQNWEIGLTQPSPDNMAKLIKLIEEG